MIKNIMFLTERKWRKYPPHVFRALTITVFPINILVTYGKVQFLTLTFKTDMKKFYSPKVIIDITLIPLRINSKTKYMRTAYYCLH